MGHLFDPFGDMAETAREWIVRLTSGDMCEDELGAFRYWASDGAHAEIFRVELGKWLELEALREFFLPDGTFLDPDRL